MNNHPKILRAFFNSAIMQKIWKILPGRALGEIQNEKDTCCAADAAGLGTTSLGQGLPS